PADPADASGWAVPGVGPRRPVLSAAESDRTDRPKDLRTEIADSVGVGAGGENSEGGEVSAHPIITAMLTCLEALHDIRGVSAASLTATEIRLMLLAVMQVAAAVFALRLRLLVAGQVQRVADLTGATTLGAFFAHLTQTRRDHANAQVRLAEDLDRRYPLLAEALAAGLISPVQVQVAVAALRRLPRTVTGDQVEACQRVLLDAAQRLSPDQLKTLGRKLWEVIDPDAAERKEGEALEDEERLARAKAYFRSWRNGDGTTGFRGKLPDLQADMLLKAIAAFAAPRRRKNPNIPTSQPDDTRHPQPQDRPGRHDSPGDDRSGDASPAGGDPSPDPLPEPPPGPPPGPPPEPEEVPYPVRLGHGLMELIERIPAELIPYSSGIAATIVVTMTLDQLRTGLGVATLDTGTEISAAQARRLSCEAGLIPVVLDGDSQPLDVGREKRFHTKSQRVVMVIQDKVCAIHGCDRPATACHFHHPVPVAEGGETSIANGAPVCPYHHGLIHSGQWTTTWHNRKARLRRRDRM
ncbi:MAG TPA: DUF222 domain-containing protein, partial [Nocardioidaceae bacterium]|nr:DUF222 domain-containing protein [Nocardioidaceae bacterium]